MTSVEVRDIQLPQTMQRAMATQAVSPLWWLFGFPFGGAFFLLAAPSLSLIVAIVVILAGMGLLARSALNY